MEWSLLSSLIFNIIKAKSFHSLFPPAFAETEAGGRTVERAQGDGGVVGEGGGGGDEGLPVQQVPPVSLVFLLPIIICTGGLDHLVILETQNKSQCLSSLSINYQMRCSNDLTILTLLPPLLLLLHELSIPILSQDVSPLPGAGRQGGRGGGDEAPGGGGGGDRGAAGRYEQDLGSPQIAASV